MFLKLLALKAPVAWGGVFLASVGSVIAIFERKSARETKVDVERGEWRFAFLGTPGGLLVAGGILIVVVSVARNGESAWQEARDHEAQYIPVTGATTN